MEVMEIFICKKILKVVEAQPTFDICDVGTGSVRSL